MRPALTDVARAASLGRINVSEPRSVVTANNNNKLPGCLSVAQTNDFCAERGASPRLEATPPRGSGRSPGSRWGATAGTPVARRGPGAGAPRDVRGPHPGAARTVGRERSGPRRGEDGEHRAAALIKQDLFDIGSPMLSLLFPSRQLLGRKIAEEAASHGAVQRQIAPGRSRCVRVRGALGVPTPPRCGARCVYFRGAWRNESQFSMIKGTSKKAPRICMCLHLF